MGQITQTGEEDSKKFTSKNRTQTQSNTITEFDDETNS